MFHGKLAEKTTPFDAKWLNFPICWAAAFYRNTGQRTAGLFAVTDSGGRHFGWVTLRIGWDRRLWFG